MRDGALSHHAGKLSDRYGNVLITAGIRGPNSRGHVFEVGKADGAVVWELQLPVDYGV